MAKLIQSSAAKGNVSVAYPSTAGEAVVQRYSVAVPTDVEAGDILELGCVPAGCRVADIVLDADQLDSGAEAAITLDVGIMSGSFGDDDATRTCGDEFFAADDVGQAGGVSRPSLATAYQNAASDTERSVGIKIKAAAATAKAGSVGITVTVVA